jgi:hypothetical protein
VLLLAVTAAVSHAVGVLLLAVTHCSSVTCCWCAAVGVVLLLAVTAYTAASERAKSSTGFETKDTMYMTNA